MFKGIVVECCGGMEGMCVCEENERVLHAYADGRYTEPMTPEQREWCIEEADKCYEGAYRREELSACDDKALANHVLHSWMDYCRSQGLI